MFYETIGCAAVASVVCGCVLYYRYKARKRKVNPLAVSLSNSLSKCRFQTEYEAADTYSCASEFVLAEKKQQFLEGGKVFSSYRPDHWEQKTISLAQALLLAHVYLGDVAEQLPVYLEADKEPDPDSFSDFLKEVCERPVFKHGAKLFDNTSLLIDPIELPKLYPLADMYVLEEHFHPIVHKNIQGYLSRGRFERADILTRLSDAYAFWKKQFDKSCFKDSMFFEKVL